MATTTNPTIEFHYDISCPYAYIASHLLPPLSTRTSSQLLYRPVLLGAIYRLTSAPQGASGSASDVFNASKKAITSASLQRTLARYGIPFNPPPRHPRKTVDALRLLWYIQDQGLRKRVSEGLFRAYWVEGGDVADREVVVRVARECGMRLGEGEVETIFGDGRARAELQRATGEAVERGAPGVPAFWVRASGDEGKLFWGQDRMHFLEALVLEMQGRLQGKSVRLRELMPRCVRPARIRGLVRVEFWFDFSSPWAFLGWTQLERMKRTFGEGLEVVMKPILLGALFKQIGAPNVPMLAISQQKLNYMSNDDLPDWVKYWNAVNAQEGRPDKEIDLRWPDEFPIRSPTLLRCAIVDPSCITLLYRACWERNANVSEEAVLVDVLKEGGYDAATLLEQASEQKTKNTLRSNTQEAFDAGVCGVPSYRVSRKGVDGEYAAASGIIWGQDELAVVEDCISGWDQQSDAGRAEVVYESGKAHL